MPCARFGHSGIFVDAVHVKEVYLKLYQTGNQTVHYFAGHTFLSFFALASLLLSLFNRFRRLCHALTKMPSMGRPSFC